MRYPYLAGGPVVAVDGQSPREWLQAADVVVGQHRTRRAARRWAGTVRRRYPGCTLVISRHRSGRWWLVADQEGRVVSATVHNGRLPAARALGLVGFHVWALSRAWL